ncbi:hypothetical protein R3P38DRAFT_3291047 [Favolaschia claudopus]|uniref:Uncharacterized protein n=1 Tax=Favolaschia claudopus TaxID=2862362 RepID=A0AAV9ZQC2_9AGAR
MRPSSHPQLLFNELSFVDFIVVLNPISSKFFTNTFAFCATRELSFRPSQFTPLSFLFVCRRGHEAVSLPRNQSHLSFPFLRPSSSPLLSPPHPYTHPLPTPTPIPYPPPHPRCPAPNPPPPSRRRAARTSHFTRPPPKLARTAASVAAAAAASASSPPPLASTSVSASAPPLFTTKTTPAKTKAPKKSKTKDPAPAPTPTQTWRHPAELPYIRSPSTKRDDGGKWDDMAIVRFIVAKAGFSMPGRSTPPEGEFFEVHFPGAASSSAPEVGVDGGDAVDEENEEEKKGKSVTLPTPYRLPLLWTTKYLWTSLHLVLTADPAIRDTEWRQAKFEILHLARLIDVLLSRSPLPSSSALPSKSPGEEDEALKTYRCPPFDRALRRFWHHWLISRDEFVRDFWREFGEEEFEEGDVLQLGELSHPPVSYLLLFAMHIPFYALESIRYTSTPLFLFLPPSLSSSLPLRPCHPTPTPTRIPSSPHSPIILILLLSPWPRWVLKGHKGFLLTKAEVANGIPLEGFLRGFWVDEERGEFGYPDNESKDDGAKQSPESSDSPSKSNGKEVVDVEGGGAGEDEDGSKAKLKKNVVKKPKSIPPAQSQEDRLSSSDHPQNAMTRKYSPAKDANSMATDNVPEPSNEEDEEIPVDPPLPHSTTSTPRPSTSQKMYIQVPSLAVGRRSRRAELSSTAMGSVRPGQCRTRDTGTEMGTGRVVGFVGDGGVHWQVADGEEKEEDVGADGDAETGDGDVNMEADDKADEGIGKGKQTEENDESELDLDSDLELGYPDEVESMPPAVAPPNEHETENLENENNSEPSLSRSVSPVLPPLSSARFPPPTPPPTIPSASTPPIQPPPQINPIPPPHPTPTNSTSDALTHFLHSFTTLTTELHALRAEVADLRRSRDLTTQLEERVRRVEGRLSAGNSGAVLSGTAPRGVRGTAVSAGGREGEGAGESASAWSHPLAHLVSFAGEDDNDAMDVDVAPQTVVEEGKLSKKRKSAGEASGSGGKMQKTTTLVMSASDSTAEPGLVSRARKGGRR